MTQLTEREQRDGYLRHALPIATDGTSHNEYETDVLNSTESIKRRLLRYGGTVISVQVPINRSSKFSNAERRASRALHIVKWSDYPSGLSMFDTCYSFPMPNFGGKYECLYHTPKDVRVTCKWGIPKYYYIRTYKLVDGEIVESTEGE